MNKTTGHWMPLYWSDYFGKTSSFSTEEHGAYLLLIGAYWQRGKPLPDDDAYLAQCTKMSRKRWRIVRPKISEHFAVLDGVWKHERVEIEILRSCARIAAASANANARWHAGGMLPTSTKEDIKSFVVGKKNGNGITTLDPANRLAIFQRILAESIGQLLRSKEQGWLIVGRAADPSLPEYAEALVFCKKHAKEKLNKGWPHQWPK